MVDVTPFLPGLSPVQGKAVVARFDGGRLSSEGGLLVLREIEQPAGIGRSLAACLTDPRAPERVVHRLAEIIRFRMLMIAAGYEDGNDADSLRADPMFKLALDRLPSDEELCSQSTISRLENLPDTRALLRLGRALIEPYCASFRQVPKRIVLDVDDTFDRVMAASNYACSMPTMTITASSRSSSSMARAVSSPRCCARASARAGMRSAPSSPPGRRHPGHLAQGRDPVACRQPLRLPGSARLVPRQPGRLVLGLAPIRRCAAMSRRWRKPPPSASGRRPRAARCGASRSFTMPPGAGAGSSASLRGSRPGPGNRHPLYRHQPSRRPRQETLPAALLCARPSREPHQGVEEPSRGRPHLMPPSRGQPVPPLPPRRRLLAVVVARRAMPRRSPWRIMQFDTLRLRLIKIAARIVELKTQIKIHLPSSVPDQAIFRLALDRVHRLIV